MRYCFVIAAFCGVVMLPPAAVAQCQPVRRALVVGINTYLGTRPQGVHVQKQLVPRVPVQGTVAARPFDDLDGAVNDANDFADLLESKGYDFPKVNVVRLLEEKATAQNILDTFQRHLVDASSCPGDIEVFYYSGHGSQIRNQYVKDETSPDRFDQTLVPYDAADGVPDIRNKELDRLYLKAAQKGVYLTVIADSCQSGGLSRGAKQFSKGKASEPDHRYVVDPGPRDASQKLLLPTRLTSGVSHAVLLLAASYETEEAKEDGDETHPHGAFTAALLKKLQDHGLHEPIGAIFDDVKFAVGLTQAAQHPQIYGEGRLELDLFGGRPNSTTGMVARVKEMRSDGNVVLDKGTLAGLYPKCQLVSVSGSSNVRLEIHEQGTSMTESVAEVKEGSFSENPQGTLFRLDKWVVPDRSALTIYYANDGPAAESLARDAAVLSELESSGMKIVTDPTVALPGGSGELRQIWWLNGAWRLLPSRLGPALELGKSLDAQRLRQIAGNAVSGSALYVNFPLPAKDAAKLDLGDGTANDAVRVQSQPDKPKKDQYVLAGKWNGKRFEYAWVRPGVTEDDQGDTNLPVRTDWVPASDSDCVDNLRVKALTLNRIYGWVTLDIPGGGAGVGDFPYRLSLRKVGTTTSLVPGKDVTTEGEKYKVWLSANPEEVTAIAKTGHIAPRWVYVIAIDRDGDTDVVIPGRQSNVGNHVPGDETPSAEIQMTSEPWDFSIAPPFGLDTYILVTSVEELDPRIFPAKGVRSRSASRGTGNPLADLIQNIGVNSRSRGEVKPVPTTWSVQKVTFRSVAAK
ncbi:MAG: caspase family protein [Acidobacteriota bacterium]|jgi:hypothetical protein